MKKRFPAIILALVLCIGLAVPAFAADGPVSSTGSFVYDLNDPEMDIDFVWDSGLFEPVDLWVRNCNREYRSERVQEGIFSWSETYLYISYDKQERLHTATMPGVHGLPSGTAFTVKGLRSTDLINLHFYADSDGDGVYDQQLVSNNSEKGLVLMPSTGKYPVGGDSFYLYDIAADQFSADAIGIQTEKGSDGLLSFTVDSDGVYQVFGGNTLITWEVDEPLENGGARRLAEGALLISKDGSLPSAAAPKFTDVPNWCSNAVDWAEGNGITQGTGNGKFSPGRDCTHAQILTFLWRAENKPDSTVTAFDHLAGDYAPAANWAYEKGLIDDSFDPSAPCTRAQAVSYIWQAFDKPEAGSGSFSDVDADAGYAAAVAWAVENGITNGYANDDGSFSFRPDTVCSRGVIATLLHRAYMESARLEVRS